MSHDKVKTEAVSDSCEPMDNIMDVVDRVTEAEIAAKLREQIEQLQGAS
ncbi:MAG: hypothetical protein H6822_25695 [Planctomycetaceae bacterium]|nr:hypothetical protein [Planctomycetaceae bacterium]